ncbi:Beta-glucuronosyltransferase GlcAT14C [Camellia lanceoleosa]|uniref:Beta-glucuronosyltransferase GlcAT14C n=1 Tax=Camellia lanceoleosa TaxID=1840588 RepID=A0ACC0GDV5_9ERIC|nr:Beta-glucuronosyltransferase GlcAT14C [Camellia lanceoleosa]
MANTDERRWVVAQVAASGNNHLRNYYLLHLDLGALDTEWLELARNVKLEPLVEEFGKVMVVGKTNLVINLMYLRV